MNTALESKENVKHQKILPHTVVYCARASAATPAAARARVACAAFSKHSSTHGDFAWDHLRVSLEKYIYFPPTVHRISEPNIFKSMSHGRTAGDFSMDGRRKIALDDKKVRVYLSATFFYERRKYMNASDPEVDIIIFRSHILLYSTSARLQILPPGHKHNHT